MSTKIYAIAAAFAVLGLIAWAISNRRVDRTVSIPQLVKKGALIIDARTPQEYSVGHVKGAVNIPYDHVTELIGGHAAEKSQPIVVYCRSGRRSGIAKDSLEKAGYTQVINAGAMDRLENLLAIGD